MLARFKTPRVQSHLVAILTALSRLAQYVKEEFKMLRTKYFDSNEGAVDKNYPRHIMFTVSKSVSVTGPVVAQRVGRGITLPFHYSGTRRG